MKPIRTKKIQIYGFTEALRNAQLDKIKAKLTKRGWIFVQYQNKEGIKAFTDGSYAEFHRLQPPSFKNSLYDWYDERKFKVWLASICLLLVPSFYACHQIAEESNEKTRVQAEMSVPFFENGTKVADLVRQNQKEKTNERAKKSDQDLLT